MPSWRAGSTAGGWAGIDGRRAARLWTAGRESMDGGRLGGNRWTAGDWAGIDGRRAARRWAARWEAMDGGGRLDEKGTVGEGRRRRGGLKCRLWLIVCTAAAALPVRGEPETRAEQEQRLRGIRGAVARLGR